MTAKLILNKYTFVLLALALLWLLAWPTVARCAVDALNSLPLTRHAQEAHKGQTWTAESIREHMVTGKCVPNEYYCEGNDTQVDYCEIKPGLSIGLVIGAKVEQIITGFAAPTDYWQDRCP